jgi:hypothetical protein
MRTEYAFTTGKVLDDKNMRVLSSGCMDTLAGAIACVAKDYAYYAIVCGYRVHCEIEPRCAECNGLGQVPSKGRLRLKRCPECKGKDMDREIISIPIPELTERTLCELRDQCQEKRRWNVIDI